MFRLNTSHGTEEEHALNIKTIRKESPFTPVLVDLQGPKIRVGNLAEPVQISIGQELILQPEAEAESCVIPVDYEGIANDVRKGEKILLDDGKVGLEVVETIGNKVRTKVLYGEVIKPRKGINIPGSTASLSAVTERDIEFIRFAVEYDADYIALSFVREAKDVELAKKYIKNFGGNIPVIAKIEKPQAVKNIDEILKIADGIMVARGDLGIEMSPTPTRAEASDVANAILDGTDAIMLSAETAAGKYPVEAVKMMKEIALNVDNCKFCPANLNLALNDNFELSPQAISNAAVKMAADLKAKAILAFSHTGYTPKLLSKLRPDVPVIMLSDLQSTCRRMSLYRGILAEQKDWDRVLDDKLLKKIDDYILETTDFKKGERIIIIGSIPKLITGRTNFIRVHRIGAPLER